jgi:hypothetical protein
MLNHTQHLSRLDLFVVYKLKVVLALKKLLTFSKVFSFIIGGQKSPFTLGHLVAKLQSIFTCHKCFQLDICSSLSGLFLCIAVKYVFFLRSSWLKP